MDGGDGKCERTRTITVLQGETRQQAAAIQNWTEQRARRTEELRELEKHREVSWDEEIGGGRIKEKREKSYATAERPQPIWLLYSSASSHFFTSTSLHPVLPTSNFGGTPWFWDSHKVSLLSSCWLQLFDKYAFEWDQSIQILQKTWNFYSLLLCIIDVRNFDWLIKIFFSNRNEVFKICYLPVLFFALFDPFFISPCTTHSVIL